MDSLIGMLIDASGSMSGSRQAVREARNEFIRLQQMRMDDCLFVSVAFNDNPSTMDNFVSVFEAAMWAVQDGNGNPYYPSGGTQFCKALVDTVQKMEARIAAAVAKGEEAPQTVTMVLQSDGDSMDMGAYSPDVFKDTVKRLKAKGWRFIFLANGARAAQLAKNTYGFPAKEVITYGNNTQKVFEGAAMDILEAI
jgi:hypothetical protein